MAEAHPVNNDYSWESLEPMPTKRCFATPVVANNMLYVVGGCDAKGVPLSDFQVYNPKASKKNRWKGLPNMPTKRAGTCAIAVDNKIVCMGGVSTSQAPLDAVEIYDIDANEWKIGDSLKDKLMGLSAVVKDGRIYVAGGMAEDTNPRSYFMSYNLETNKWSSLSPMPTPRYATFSFLIKDKLYVIGGRQGKLPCSALEMYDFEKGEWRKLPDIPSRRVFALFVHTDTHLYSLGGLNQNAFADGFSSTTEVFDLEKEEWTVGSPMQAKRGDFAAAVIGGKVVVAGGLANEGKPLNEAECYDQTTNTWTSLPTMPHPHSSCASVMYNNKLHIIGGLSTGGATNLMDVLSFNSSE